MKEQQRPEGNWNFDNIIGATVLIKSMKMGNFYNISTSKDPKVIKNIYFRVSSDGKTIPVVELEGLVNKYFTFSDLEILTINEDENS